ncbi:unnamed protein product [Ixodes hexagonus]
MPIKIAVVGAGVVGLATAVRTIESIENAQVTVISETFTPHTTGDVSVGLFEPFLVDVGSRDLFFYYRAWTVDAFNFYYSLIKTTDTPEQLGLDLVPVYKLFDNFTAKPLYADAFIGYRDMTPEELAAYPGNYKYGAYFESISIICIKFLPYMMQRFINRGGHFIHDKVDSLDQLAGKYDVVMNCPGIGAVSLVPDPSVYPIRGQTTWVRAPWVKRIVVAGEFYIIPNVDAIVLGGTANKGDFSRTPVPETRQKILDACIALEPSLKKATFIRDHVGLRPGRSPVRIEIEDRIINNTVKTLPIVHNYGHGGCGITVCWGSAGDAVALLEQVIADKGLSANLQSKL